MTTSAQVTSILRQITGLSEAEQAELRVRWENPATNGNGHHTEAAHAQSAHSDADAFAWINKHGSAYAGQWLALEGDRLLAHGANLAEVATTARALGVQFPLLHLVEPPREHPYIHD